MQDHKEAIEVARLAVWRTAEDRPDRAGRLNNLGNKLGRRYERTGEMQDLEEAIQVARLAVESTPEDNPDRARRLKDRRSDVEGQSEQTGGRGDVRKEKTATRQ